MIQLEGLLASLVDTLQSCEMIETEEVCALSDHNPVVITLTLTIGKQPSWDGSQPSVKQQTLM